MELSALKITIIAIANVEFRETYLNLDLFICNHKSWMSPWDEILMIQGGENWGEKSIKMLRLASITQVEEFMTIMVRT